ncbi:MAG: glycosyltransferase family 4 protein [Thermoanaerobaculia bacterium]
MRILIVTNTYPPADISGVGTLVFELARQLDATGHAVRVLVRRAAENDELAEPVPGAKLLFPLRAAARFVALARRQQLEVVHLHESDGVLVALAVRLARLFGCRAGSARVVATLQVSYRRERWAVRRLRVDGRIIARPTAGERLFAWLRAPLLSIAGRLTASLADAVVAPSRVTAGELESDYGCRVAAVIANGITPLALPPAPPAGPGVEVLYAGRLRTRKAVAVLVEAFARVHQRAPGARLRLLGDGEQRPALEEQVRRLELSDVVRFEGAVPHGRMPELYAAADIFCLPSLYEGFPLAILEAMAAGLPVVATRVAGNPEAVDDGVHGRLVEAEDAAGLAAALLDLIADEESRHRMGRQARQRIEEEFSIERIGAAYRELWEGLAGPGAGSTSTSVSQVGAPRSENQPTNS